MGCDIQLVLEKKIDDMWVGLHAFPYAAMSAKSEASKYPIQTGSSWLARSRNYELFADLAGVRGEGRTGNTPRGLPDDISPLGRLMSNDADGHSHTHMLLSEAAMLFLIHHIPGAILEDRRKELQTEMFGLEDYDHEPNLDEYRLIIWFDN